MIRMRAICGVAMGRNVQLGVKGAVLAAGTVAQRDSAAAAGGLGQQNPNANAQSGKDAEKSSNLGGAK